MHRYDKLFTSSGKLGDLVAALPTIRALGGGHIRFTLKTLRKNFIDRAACDSMSILLAGLPYIRSVGMYNFEPIDHNLDFIVKHAVEIMRRGPGSTKPLTDIALDAFKLPLHHRDSAWITDVPVCVPTQDVVINRTPRYHSGDFPWSQVLAKYPQAVFVGLDDEYDYFQMTFGKLPRVKAANVLELAQVISGCKLFIGNQSLALWLAEAMKKPVVVECWKRYASNVFIRPGAVHWFDGPLQLPEVV